MGRGGLIEFVRYFWPVLEPKTLLVDGWCLDAVCAHLEAVTFGEINRLLINVPPGFCKPVCVDEPVFTTRGMVRLGDIVVGDKVLTHLGRFRSVTAIHEQGVVPTVIVRTFAGRNVRAAPDHPFLTPRGWIAAGNLTNCDYVGFPRKRDEISIDIISPEEARLLGYLVGDGCISNRSLAFVNADEDVLCDFIHCAKAVGFYAERKTHPNAGVKATKVVLKSTDGRWGNQSEPPVLAWLRGHGLYCSNSYTKRIPLSVFASSDNVLKNFIGAYWSCDGMIAVRHKGKKTTMIAEAVTVSCDLAKDIQHALSLINISSRIRKIERPFESQKQKGPLYVSYRVLTSERNEVAKFIDLPGLCERKLELARKAFPDCFEPDIYADAVIGVQVADDAKCRCLTVEEDESFVVGGLIVHNSLLTNVFWPAWEWSAMGMSHLRYISFSYSVALTERDNGKFRDLLLSAPFQQMYGKKFGLRKIGEQLISNDKTGYKRASSVGGIGTGERGDRAIIDDAHNVKEAESEVVRNETVRWFRESVSNRLNDMGKSAIVGIMQRVHEEDVSGIIIDTQDYCHLMIPMEFDPDRRCETTIGWIDPREDDNELAWPARFPAHVVESLKRDLGPYAYAAQYEQSPTPRGGAIFLRDWWQVWEAEDGRYPIFDFVLASLDPAFTEKEENDPSALTVWGVWTDENGVRKVMLMDAWRKRLQMHGSRIDQEPAETKVSYIQRTRPEWGLVEWVAHTCRRWKVDRLLVEAKASGITAAQEIERLYGDEQWAVQLMQVKGDKVSRAHAVVPAFSQRLVYAPDREWAEMVIKEAAGFPKAPHDDLCFAAGTLIATRRGDIAIEFVKVGDAILTPMGWRQVLSCGMTGHSPVITRQGLTGTIGHPIFTFENGYLSLGDPLLFLGSFARATLCGLMRTILLSPSNLTELSSDAWAGRDDTISPSQPAMKSANGRKDCTSQFGNFTADKVSRLDMKFTIAIMIRLIVVLKTWSVYRAARTAQWLRKTGLMLRNGILTVFGRWLRCGTDLMQGALGINSMPFVVFARSGSKSTTTRLWGQESAFGVGSNLQPAAEGENFAVGNVKLRNQAIGEEGTNSFTHSIVPVYNLTVEEAHCYYANGVLVHNCDSMTQAFKHLRDLGLIQHPEERLADETRRSMYKPQPKPLYAV